MGLALAGMLIGLLALSATALAKLVPPAEETPTAGLQEAGRLVGTAGPEELRTEPAAIPVLAEQEAPEEDPDAGPFRVSYRVRDPVPGEKLFVCDGLGCPLQGIEPDQKGEGVLAPLDPGRYSIQQGQTEIGRFRLGSDARLSETAGRVWTDGERLCLERFTPGTVRLTVTLRAPGYYTVALWDQDGRVQNRDIYVAEGTRPDGEAAWVRVLDFQGLPAGLYTAVRRNQPLGQVKVSAGETAALAIEITSDK